MCVCDLCTIVHYSTVQNTTAKSPPVALVSGRDGMGQDRIGEGGQIFGERTGRLGSWDLGAGFSFRKGRRTLRVVCGPSRIYLVVRVVSTSAK